MLKRLFNNRHLTKVTAIALCAALFAGCQTYGQGGALGAGLGAGAGAAIGSTRGKALEGALIGAVAGAAVGLIGHDIKARRAKSQEQTAREYQYEPAQGEMLTWENGLVQPQNARPGEMVTATAQYALLGSGGGVQVTESRRLYQGDRMIAEVSTRNFTRTDGTWASEQNIRVPNNLGPGHYSIRTEITTKKSRISGNAPFFVE